MNNKQSSDQQNNSGCGESLAKKIIAIRLVRWIETVHMKYYLLTVAIVASAMSIGVALILTYSEASNFLDKASGNITPRINDVWHQLIIPLNLCYANREAAKCSDSIRNDLKNIVGRKMFEEISFVLKDKKVCHEKNQNVSRREIGDIEMFPPKDRVLYRPYLEWDGNSELEAKYFMPDQHCGIVAIINQEFLFGKIELPDGVNVQFRKNVGLKDVIIFSRKLEDVEVIFAKNNKQYDDQDVVLVGSRISLLRYAINKYQLEVVLCFLFTFFVFITIRVLMKVFGLEIMIKVITKLIEFVVNKVVIFLPNK